MAAPTDVPFPPELARFGRPNAMHAVRGAGATALVVMGVLFLVGAGVFLLVYARVPATAPEAGGSPPETLLHLAFVFGALGVMLLGLGMSRGKPRGWGEAYFLFPEHLVWLDRGSVVAAAWSDVRAIVSPRGLCDYRLELGDGSRVPIKHAARDYRALIATVVAKLEPVLLRPLEAELDAGAVVTVGPFALTKDGIAYQGKELRWLDAAVVELVVGRAGRRLRIRASGAVLPFCYADIDGFPNGVLVPELLQRVLPAHLRARR